MRSAPFRVSDKAVDALSLMAHSDAVLSGGGTMAREAAIIGNPCLQPVCRANQAQSMPLSSGTES